MRLAGGAQDGGDRREEHEKVEVEVTRELMQVPCSNHLRRQHTLERVARQVDQEVILENSGGVDDSTQVRDAVQQDRDGIMSGYVDGYTITSAFWRKDASRASWPRSGAWRLTSARCRAPCRISQAAISRPTPPNPPVIR